MTTNDLHTRLETLGAKIAAARKALVERARWTDGHQLTAGELEARHRYLLDEVRRETGTSEAHDRHVSDLEASVRQWVDSLDL